MAKTGVLALQGDFAEHLRVLERLGADGVEVRIPADLEGIDGLIIPGGESTTIRRLLDLYALTNPLTERISGGMPAWGTCAGLILLARELTDDHPRPLGLVDMVVARNAFGRQVDSFEEDIEVPALGDRPFHAVFIRAPVIRKVGTGVEVLSRLQDGAPVAARQGKVLVTAFHPELTGDTRFHECFLSWVLDT